MWNIEIPENPDEFHRWMTTPDEYYSMNTKYK